MHQTFLEHLSRELDQFAQSASLHLKESSDTIKRLILQSIRENYQSISDDQVANLLDEFQSSPPAADVLAIRRTLVDNGVDALKQSALASLNGCSSRGLDFAAGTLSERLQNILSSLLVARKASENSVSANEPAAKPPRLQIDSSPKESPEALHSPVWMQTPLTSKAHSGQAEDEIEKIMADGEINETRLRRDLLIGFPVRIYNRDRNSIERHQLYCDTTLSSILWRKPSQRHNGEDRVAISDISGIAVGYDTDTFRAMGKRTFFLPVLFFLVL